MLESIDKQPSQTPYVPSKVSLSKTKLSLSYQNKKQWFDIDENGCVNLIELDMWLTGIFKAEYDKVQLRKSLGGK